MAHKKILRTIVGTLLAEQRFIFILQGTFGTYHRFDRVDSRPGGINEQKDSSNPASRCTRDGRVEHNRELD